MSRVEQVLNENKKIDNLVKEIKELSDNKLSNNDITTLTITSINKQLVEISVTMAMIYDLLNKEGE